MPENERVYFTPANLTKSLKISSTSYVENEYQVKNSSGAIFSGVRRDYLFTVQNLSSKTIDSIIIIFRKNGTLKHFSDEFYDELGGLQPQGSSEIRISVKPDETPTIEAIIFRDYTYEGNPEFAEARIARFKAKKDKISELMALFNERNLLSIDDDKVLRNNVNEIRALLEKEREKYKAKERRFRNRLEAQIAFGEGDGIRYVDFALRPHEQNPDRYGMRQFINRITERTKF